MQPTDVGTVGHLRIVAASHPVEQTPLHPSQDGDGKVTLEESLGEDNELVAILDKAKGDMKMARELAGDNHYSLNWVQTTLGTFRLADGDGDGALDSGEFFQCVMPPPPDAVTFRHVSLCCGPDS
jgi:hypothetical protein